jgi:preprotein translocase subunit SecA
VIWITPLYQDSLLSIHQFRADFRMFVDASEFVNYTNQLVRRFKEGETVEFLLPEAFALVMEAFYRVYGITINDMQLCGAITLHYGEVAEMKTGEGKTCIAVFAAYLNALPGDGVHIRCKPIMAFTRILIIFFLQMRMVSLRLSLLIQIQGD